MKQILAQNILNEFTDLISSVAAQLDAKAYLVGGGLRDALMGRETNDSDFVLSGAEEELPRIFAAKTGGTFFWLDRKRLQSRVIIKQENNLATFDFAPMQGHDIVEDLALRDFTINALALPLLAGEFSIVDPFAGMLDMRQGIIRACSGKVFDNDPLRLLRAFRFEAVLGFVIETGTWRNILSNAQLLRKVASERIRDEFFRILDSSNAAVSLERLRESGLLCEILECQLTAPEAVRGRIHNVSEIERTIDESDIVAANIENDVRVYLSKELESGVKMGSIMKLAAYLRRPGYGSGLVPQIADNLKLGSKARKVLKILVEEAEPVLVKSGYVLTKRVFYRYFRDHEPAGLALLITALAGKQAPIELCRSMLKYFFHEYGNENEDTLLSGEEIMEILGVSPGRTVGEALKQLKNAESIGLVTSKSDAREYIAKNLLTKSQTVI